MHLLFLFSIFGCSCSESTEKNNPPDSESATEEDTADSFYTDNDGDGVSEGHGGPGFLVLQLLGIWGEKWGGWWEVLLKFWGGAVHQYGQQKKQLLESHVL